MLCFPFNSIGAGWPRWYYKRFDTPGSEIPESMNISRQERRNLTEVVAWREAFMAAFEAQVPIKWMNNKAILGIFLINSEELGEYVVDDLET